MQIKPLSLIVVLCDDLIYEVLCFLDKTSLHRASLVSKHWNQLIEGGFSPVWKQLLCNSMKRDGFKEDISESRMIQCKWKDEVRRYIDFMKGKTFWENRKHTDSKISDRMLIVYNAPPISHPFVRCYVTETKRSLRANIYTMFHEETNTPLLFGKLSQSNPILKKYSIYPSRFSTDPIAKLISKKLGTQFVLHDKTSRNTKMNIHYSSNILHRSYNRLRLEMCDVSQDAEFVISTHQKERKFKNRDPVWDPHYHSWTLNFGGRVKQKSARNFQVMEENEEKIHNFLIFGRIDSETFVLDYRHPFNALQAFCLALSALDCKIACM